jgi:hypothetical protein
MVIAAIVPPAGLKVILTSASRCQVPGVRETDLRHAFGREHDHNLVAWHVDLLHLGVLRDVGDRPDRPGPARKVDSQGLIWPGECSCPTPLGPITAAIESLIDWHRSAADVVDHEDPGRLDSDAGAASSPEGGRPPGGRPRWTTNSHRSRSMSRAATECGGSAPIGTNSAAAGTISIAPDASSWTVRLSSEDVPVPPVTTALCRTAMLGVLVISLIRYSDMLPASDSPRTSSCSFGERAGGGPQII